MMRVWEYSLQPEEMKLDTKAKIDLKALEIIQSVHVIMQMQFLRGANNSPF